MMRARMLVLLLLLGCGRSSNISPRECGGGCSSTDECRNTGTGCGVCFGGHCTSSLPAEPVNDAGVDAPRNAQ